MRERERLRIAVQKSGRLGDSSRELLARCGLRFRESRDKLFCYGEGMPIDLLRVRDDDIPGLIDAGVCDLGFVGRNVLGEYMLGNSSENGGLREIQALGFGACRLSIAIPQNDEWQGPEQLAGQRIATTYPNLLRDWLLRNQVEATAVALSGSVEIAPRLGTADLICDLVSSGATLQANQLKEAVVLLQSATLPDDERGELLEQLLQRLDSVRNVRASRLVMLQAPRAAATIIAGLLPGCPQPTVTTIDGRADQVAMQAVCKARWSTVAAGVAGGDDAGMKHLVWKTLTAAERAQTLRRPVRQGDAERQRVVADIIARVRRQGDAALRELTQQLDGCEVESLPVSPAEFEAAEALLSTQLKQAIAEARQRIEIFHRATMSPSICVETSPGVLCERLLRPISPVGLYVPAGSAPLPSTALMLGVPAQLAGCPEVVLCTPAKPDGRVDAAVLVAAQACGIKRVFKLGGAQAIAAMAFGTDSVPACDKLFGPGNSWVTEAKLQVSAEPGGPAIDLPAGPSELLVIADNTADAGCVAADLLSQAEHGPDSQVLLLTDAVALINAVEGELQGQLAALPRRDIAGQALAESCLIQVDALELAVEISNTYAPEHLILNVAQPRALLTRVETAGSVFLGPWSPESVGDYCSGTNHVLPTDGYARAWSGLSVASFQKQITVQELSAKGLQGIAGCAITLARAEGLEAHAQAVSRRLPAAQRCA